MGTIEINVSVELNLSNDAKAFIASLFNQVASKPAAQETLVQVIKAPLTAPAAPVASAPAPKPAAQAPAPKPTVSIEDVRKALAAKVNNYRAEIKEKLNECGAKSVTELDPEKYKEMFDFINALGNE